MNNTLQKDTICLTGGIDVANGEPRALPINQSTTYYYDSIEHMCKLFDLSATGYLYSRIHNPTNDAVAKKICELEGGVAAMLTSSGQAATFFAITNICSAGDHFICSSGVYGGTINLFSTTLKRFGIECTYVDQEASETEISKAFKPNTKAVFAESIANPALAVLDFCKFSKLSKKHGVPLIVDNTFATPINCQALKHGADIVVHSTTKYMDGHGTCIGGAIVDSGNFDWDKYSDKFPYLTTPDSSYHGLVYTKAFGKAAYIFKAVVQLQRDIGACPSPLNSFILNTHLESLALRIERHSSNALKVAQYLQKQTDIVSWVKFPQLKGDKYNALAKKYMPNGTCGVVTFGLKGGRDVAIKFLDSLKLTAIATHVADARTCALYPAGTTHRQCTPEQLAAAGVTQDLVRISIGIENPNDIIADIAQALANC